MLAHYRAEFPIFAEKIYLNTCSLGALSTRAEQSVAHFHSMWHARGASAWYDVWWEALGQLRSGYAQVLNALPSEIALHASVSTATAVLASSIDYSRRPRVVTTSLDFPTVAYQWLVKQESGVELVIVESPDGISVPLEAIAEAVDERTALVATSHVFFTSGAIQDIKAIADIAHRNGALCFVDAYQSVGQLPLDVRSTGVDFLCAGGLKWLLGGTGIVFLYVRDELTPKLVPTVSGWFGNERQFDFDLREMVWHSDARRFEQGTPALSAVYAQLGGLGMILEIGVPKIREVVSELTGHLISSARSVGLEPKVHPDPDNRTAIVMVPHDDPAGQVKRLADAGIIVDARPGHVRLSPFFYNIKDDNVAAIEVLKA
ncbi:MAG: aminotransferase class V-fold PLP-dependent enzyme [Gemmatimonadota bacterium]|nr:MAG: aminotransferase class V-fold PLP-dependent enzyme [Gemmatimonadota bacterium]